MKYLKALRSMSRTSCLGYWTLVIQFSMQVEELHNKSDSEEEGSISTEMNEGSKFLIKKLKPLEDEKNKQNPHAPLIISSPPIIFKRYIFDRRRYAFVSLLKIPMILNKRK